MRKVLLRTICTLSVAAVLLSAISTTATPLTGGLPVVYLPAAAVKDATFRKPVSHTGRIAAANKADFKKLTVPQAPLNLVCGVNTISFTTPGFQNFIVPVGVTKVTITAVGAAGGNYSEDGGATIANTGGAGALIKGSFSVTAGENINVLVGGKGNDNVDVNLPPAFSPGGGGGGGSFVAKNTFNAALPMLAAGGGGGAGLASIGDQNLKNANIPNVFAAQVNYANDGVQSDNPSDPWPASGDGGVAGTAGSGGDAGGGGAGWLMNGENDIAGTIGAYGPEAIINTGGISPRFGGHGGEYSFGGKGGFGGGGSAAGGAGGGGGYSGGGGGGVKGDFFDVVFNGNGVAAGLNGGGGGSYNDGLPGTQVNTPLVGTGDGYVIIEYTYVAPIITGGKTSFCAGEQFPYLNGCQAPGVAYTWSSSNPSVAVVNNMGLVIAGAPGTATITLTDENGSYSSQDITVNPAPVVSPVSGATAVTVGGTSMLSSTPGGGVWSSNNTGVATIDASTGLVSGVSAGTATISYLVTTGSGCSKTVTTDVTVISSASPLIPGSVGAPQTICSGLVPAVLSSIADASGGTGTIAYQWQSSSDNNNFSDIPGATSATYAPVALTATTYYRRGASTATNPVQYTSSVMVTVKALPIISSVSGNTDICARRDTRLTANSSAPSPVFNWYNSSNNLIYTGSELSTGNLFVTTTYYVEVVSNGCTSAKTPVTVNVKPMPPQPIISQTENCDGTTTLTITNPEPGAIIWFVNMAFPSTVITANSVVATGPATYKSIQNGANTCQSYDVTINVAANTKTTPPAPTGINVATCEPSSANIGAYGANGETIKWYTAATGGSPIATGNNYLTNTPGTYYAEAVNAGGCASATRTAVTASINPQPSALTFSVVDNCNGTATITINNATGSVLWNTNATTPSITVSSTGVYAARQIVNGCYSNQNSVMVSTFGTAPPAPTVSGTTVICPGKNTRLTASSTVNGVSFRWYDASNTLVSNGNDFSASAAQTYYVEAVNNGCVSPRTAVTISFSTPPPTPVVTTTENCDGTTTLLQVAPVANVVWRNVLTPTNIIAGNPITVTGPATYETAQQDANGCISQIIQVVVNANTKSLPTISGISGSTDICARRNTSLTASSAAPSPLFKWYNSSNSLIYTGSTFFTGDLFATTTYYVEVVSNGCTSAKTPVTVNVKPMPPQPIISQTQNCDGTTTLAITNAEPGATVMFVNTAVIPNTPIVANSVIVTGPAIYKSIQNGANGCQSYDVTINVAANNNTIQAPTVTAEGPTTFCAGGSVTLVASEGSSYLWSNGETTQMITTSVAGSYTVSVTNASGCIAVSEPTVVTVSVPPVVTITADGPTSICFGTPRTLTVNAPNGGLWNTQEFAQSITVYGGADYSVTVLSDDQICSVTASITITTLPTPYVAQITGPQEVCANGSIQLQNETPGGVWSSSNPAVANVDANGHLSVVGRNDITEPTYIYINYTITNESGCSEYVTYPVTVLPAPLNGPLAGPTTICVNGTFPLNPMVPVGRDDVGNWTSSNPSVVSVSAYPAGAFITGVSAGTAIVNYYFRNVYGCNALVGSAEITVTPSFVATITAAGPTALCAGGSVVLTASAGASYAWSNGENTQTITTSIPGSYTVTVTNESGCSATSAPTEVSVMPAITPAFAQVAAICAGANLDALPTTSNNGVTGTWAPALNNTATTTYTFTPDAGQCATSVTMTIAVNALPTITAIFPTCAGRSRQLIGSGTPAASNPWTSSDPSVATVNNAGLVTGVAVAGGTTVITYTDVNGCSITTNFIVNPTPPTPTVSIVNNCDGTSTLTAAGYSGYQWALQGGQISATGTSITVTTPGTYGVRSTNGQCVSAFVYGTAAPKTKPVASISADGAVSVCPSNAVILHATTAAGNTYQWLQNGNTINGATGADYSATATGIYTVVITNNGCTSDASNAISVTVADAMPPATPVLPAIISECSVTVPVPMATDNCAGTIAGTTGDPLTYTTQGTYTIHWTFYDGNGNSTTVNQLVVVRDVTPPSIVCPANITVSATSPLGAVVTFAAPIGTDNCAGVSTSQTAGLPSGALFPVGTTTQTYTVTDAAGNTVSCSFDVVVDCVPPVFTQCVTNQTVNTDAGLCTAVVNYTASASGLPIANLSYTFSGATTGSGSGTGSGAIFNKGVTTVTIRAANVCGTATCSFTVEVVDNENPVIVNTPSNIHQPNDAGQCGAVISWTAPTVSDNCPGVTIVASHQSGTVFPVGTTVVTYTATDASGHIVTTQFSVTVTDDENPIITIPADITHSADARQCSYTFGTDNNGENSQSPNGIGLGTGSSSMVLGTATATDNCSVALVTGIRSDAQPLNAPFPVGITTIQWTVTDAHGHTAGGIQTVSITDDEFPVINGMPGTQTVANAPGTCGAVVNWIAPAAADNCPGVTLVADHQPGEVFPIGTSTVHYTATDAHGHTTTSSFDVVVADTEKPAVQCPSDITVSGNTGLNGAIVTYTVVSADNCGTPSVTTSVASGSYFPMGITQVTVTVTDAGGNQVTCSFTVTVLNNPPVAQPDVATTQEDTPVSGSVLTNDSDADGNAVTVTGYTVNSVSYTAGSTATLVEGELVINADGSFIFTPAANYNGPVPVVNYTIVDGNGATATSTLTIKIISVNDQPIGVNDVASVNEDGILNGSVRSNDTESGDGGNTWNVVTTTTHGILTLNTDGTYTYTPAPDFHGTDVFTYQVCDADGDCSVARVAITVNSVNDPSIILTKDITVYLDATGNVSITAGQIDDGSYDPDGIASITIDQSNFSCANVGANHVTMTVTDANGNVSTAVAVVTVVDNIAPVITCPAPLTVTCASAVPAPNTGSVVVSDNCSAVLTWTGDVISNQQGLNKYTITRTYSATDPSGNTTACTQVITVKDDIAPVLTGVIPGTTGLQCIADVPGAPDAADIASQFRDNCSGIVTAVLSNTSITGDNATGWAVTYSYAISDASGNTTTVRVIYTGKDTKAPVPVITQLPTVTGECAATVTAPVAIDNCGGTITGTTSSALHYTAQGTYFIEWTYNDGNGNVSTQSQTVIVKDVTAPVVNCPANITVNASAVLNGQGGAYVTYAATASDNCGTPVVSYSIAPGSFFPTGSTLVTVTAVDAKGNTSTCTFTVTVGCVNPVISISSVPTNNTFTGGIPTNLFLGYGAQSTMLQVTAPAGSTYVWTGNGASMLSSTTSANPVFTPITGGSYTFVVTVMNASGCTSSASITICVTDIRVPGSNVSSDDDDDHGEGDDDHDDDGDDDDDQQRMCNHSAHSSSSCSHKGHNHTCDHKSHSKYNCAHRGTNDRDDEDQKDCDHKSHTYKDCSHKGHNHKSCDHKAHNTADCEHERNHGTNQKVCDHQSHSSADCSHEGHNHTSCSHTAHNSSDCSHGDDNEYEGNASGNYKVFLCHVPPGNPGKTITLSISINAVAAHLTLHPGDRLGSCDQQPCSVYTDNVKPVISCPANMIVSCGGSTLPAATGKATATDNSGSVTVSYTDVTNGNIITRTWKATDAAGNYSTAIQVITVGTPFTTTITSVPNNSTYTGGIATNLYIGYGPQNTKLQVGSLPSAGAPYTYAWSGSSDNRLSSSISAAPVFTPLTFGYYSFSVTVTNKYGCKSTASINICVTDIRVPGSGGSKVYMTHTTTGKYGRTQTIEVPINQVSSHLSSGSCGSNGQDRLGSADQSPCNTTVQNSVVANTATTTKEGATETTTSEEELKVTVLPNPSTTYFTLKLESKYAAPVDLRVLDANGRVVDAKSKLGSNSTLQIGHNYSSGTYYAEMIQGAHRKVVQLIKGRG